MNAQSPTVLQLSSGPQNCSPHFTPWSAVTVRNLLVRSLPLRRSAGPQVRSPHFTPGRRLSRRVIILVRPIPTVTKLCYYNAKAAIYNL